MKTDKDIFQIVKDHLLNQMRRSILPFDGCAYHGEENTKCAVGVLISDQFYDASLEGHSIGYADVANALQLSNPDWKIKNSGLLLLSKLQELHDTELPVSWEYFLSKFEFSEDGSFLNSNWWKGEQYAK